MLGMLICATGLIWAPLAWLCGWIAWPILWYTYTIVLLCAQPWAYTPMSNVDQSLAWSYYSLLALLLIMLHLRWPTLSADASTHAGSEMAPPLARGFPRSIWRLVLLGAAILIVLGTGIIKLLMTQPNGLLTITFLSVGLANQPPQGEAILVRTPGAYT